MKVRKVVIPVAGLGTRMLPATKVVPKELVAVAGKPAVQWVVEAAVQSGVEEVIFVIAPGKSEVADHFRPAPALEEILRRRGKRELLEVVQAVSRLARIRTAVQHEPLGLGHAVLMAREAVAGEPFAVVLPDELVLSRTPALAQVLEACGQGEPCIGLVRVPPEEISRYGIVTATPRDARTVVVTDVVEKPRREDAPSDLAICGPYVLPGEAFDDLGRVKPAAGGEIYLTDALVALARRRTLLGRLIEGERLDVGHPAGFVEANVALALADPELGPPLRRSLARRL